MEVQDCRLISFTIYVNNRPLTPAFEMRQPLVKNHASVWVNMMNGHGCENEERSDPQFHFFFL